MIFQAESFAERVPAVSTLVHFVRLIPVSAPSVQSCASRPLRSLLMMGALQACTEFASSADKLGSSGSVVPSDSAVITPARCPSASERCSAGGAREPEAQSGAAPASSTSIDAGLLRPPTSTAEPDAGAAVADAEPRPPDAVAYECSAPGELTVPESSACLLWVIEPVTWEAARDACFAWGGRLVQIESDRRDVLIQERMSADAWIGASDRGAEGALVWSDGSALSFANWAEAQPDDFDGGEDCVEKLLRNGRWNDQRCDKQNAYVCERQR